MEHFPRCTRLLIIRSGMFRTVPRKSDVLLRLSGDWLRLTHTLLYSETPLSMFRSGWTGIALLIMRLSLIAALFLHAPQAFWSRAIFLSIAVALGLGALTSTACLLFCAAQVWLGIVAVRFDPTVPILSIPMAIALILLGPGAYSIDARIFGRRVIVLPPK